MSATPNQSKLEAAIDKLHAFCSAQSLLKSDEELIRSFDSFVTHTYSGLVKERNGTRLNDPEALRAALSLLYELGTQLIAEGDQHGTEDSQTDSGNRLFASLKRHPE